MNDYAFGQRIFEFRRRTGLTQADMAAKLGVTGKAVSKWENGRSKPSTEMLRKLAALFGTSVEMLLDLKEGRGQRMPISKIVITGGPSAGKTTAMSWIQNTFTKQGYAVLFVPETATELISGGVAPWTCGSNVDYQLCQVKLQLEKERVFQQAAGTMKAGKVLIVCDRGVLDNKAYMTDLEFSQVLNKLGVNEIDMRDQYDAVFHMVTAAKGAEKFYTLENNSARTETPEQAAALDDKLLAAWTGHPHLRVIDNSTDFENKLKRVIAEISAFLGEPEPFEIERKYLIDYPDTKMLESLPNCSRVEIIQTYLKTAGESEIRVRQRGADGNYIYTRTEKTGVTDVRRIEVERRLTKEEYLDMLMDADTSLRQIRKTRYCLAYKNQYFEIDTYPFWTDRAVMEIELRTEDEKIVFPDFINVVREITGDGRYKNRSLARPGSENQV